MVRPPTFATYLSSKSRSVQLWRNGQYGSLHRARPVHSPALPFDIIFLIAHCITNDVRTLRAFTLVCREWRTASRGFILETITMDTRRRTVKKFRKLIEGDPSAGDLVRCIRLQSLVHLPGQEVIHEDWLCDALSLLGQKLPNVYSLEITNLGFLPLSSQFFQQLSTAQSVNTLCLVNYCLVGSALNSFIDSLPQLLDLRIHKSQRAPNSTASLVPPSQPIPQLKSVAFHSSGMLDFLNWLRPITTLTSIGLHLDSPECLSPVGSLLRPIGDALEHLELRLLYKDWSEPTCLHTKLRSLCLYGLDKPSTSFILSELTSPHIRSITLSDADGSPEACVNAENFQLDSILSSRRFKRLTEVNLIYCGKATDRELTKIVNVVFPRLRKKRILRTMRSIQHATGSCCFR